MSYVSFNPPQAPSVNTVTGDAFLHSGVKFRFCTFIYLIQTRLLLVKNELNLGGIKWVFYSK